MRMFRNSVLMLSFLIVGCSTMATKTNQLHLGMTKAEVLELMDDPDHTKSKGNIEVLSYLLGTVVKLWERSDEYWVVLEKGHVIQFGRAGDFGSSEPSITEKLIIDKTEHTEHSKR